MTLKRIPRYPKGRPSAEGREALRSRVVVYCDGDIEEKLIRIARAQRVSRSDILRYAVSLLDESEYVR